LWLQSPLPANLLYSIMIRRKMAKSPSKRLTPQNKIVEIAKRRAGASYIDAASAAQDRLLDLREEYESTPPSYRGYLAVGICSCLESHIKYYYAAAAEGFDDHPDVLKLLFKDIQVDIETLISTASRSFGLADVVAASITVSSLKTYRDRASHFFTVFTGKKHDFPWDMVGMLDTKGAREMDQQYAMKLGRLERIFEARHKFIHETNVFAHSETELLHQDVLESVDDALALMEQFERQYEHILQSPKYAAIKDNEGLDDAIARNLSEIDEAFAFIKSNCAERQHERLDKFKKAFIDYLWSRCDFETSAFVLERSEWSMTQFLDLAPEYKATLNEIALQQKFMVASYPVAEQLLNAGIEIEDDQSK
jgi:hypothetical protein